MYYLTNFPILRSQLASLIVNLIASSESSSCSIIFTPFYHSSYFSDEISYQLCFRSLIPLHKPSVSQILWFADICYSLTNFCRPWAAAASPCALYAVTFCYSALLRELQFSKIALGACPPTDPS